MAAYTLRDLAIVLLIAGLLLGAMALWVLSTESTDDDQPKDDDA